MLAGGWEILRDQWSETASLTENRMLCASLYRASLLPWGRRGKRGGDWGWSRFFKKDNGKRRKDDGKVVLTKEGRGGNDSGKEYRWLYDEEGEYLPATWAALSDGVGKTKALSLVSELPTNCNLRLCTRVACRRNSPPKRGQSGIQFAWNLHILLYMDRCQSVPGYVYVL